MYAQLGAIAREFNFPSIVGISLYMHIDEAGTLFTPRISEESWGILWGHLFAPNAPGSSGGLPISGRIEFDIGALRKQVQITFFGSHDLQTLRKLGGMTHGVRRLAVRPHPQGLCHPLMSLPCINIERAGPLSTSGMSESRTRLLLIQKMTQAIHRNDSPSSDVLI